MNNKLIGAVLLIIGTSIGGAMLALPIESARGGFVGASLFMLLTWIVMTAGALLILEVCVLMPPRSNLISMAGYTLGRSGQIAAWLLYFLLLYALISAYVAGGRDVIHGLVLNTGIDLPPLMSAGIFVLLMGSIVYAGVHVVDYVNRGLIVGKLGIYIILVILLAPAVHRSLLQVSHPKYLIPAVGAMITSFGYAVIIPTLRDYLDNDIRKLRFAVITGSLVPFLFYVVWIGIVIGVLPRTGRHGLLMIRRSSEPISSLANSISHYFQNPWVTTLIHTFVSIAVLTSFLAVSLSMTDFLADGFKVKKRGKGGVLVYSMTFLPPLCIALFFPRAFIGAISYAGIFCILLLVLLPIGMAWNARYIRKMSEKYHLIGGKGVLITLALVCVTLIIFDLF